MGGRAGIKKFTELWISATFAATKFLKIVSSGDPVGLETKWVLPSALPVTGQILDATLAGTTVTLNWVNKPSGGGGSPFATSLSSAANSVQVFRGTSGAQFATLEFYDLLVVPATTAPQLAAIGGNALLWTTGIDTNDLLVHPRLQAIAAAANPSQAQIPQLNTSGVLSFVNKDTFASATGTTSTTFVLDSGVTPVMLKDVGGNLVVRTGADNANADLTVQNITITGNVTLSGTGTLVTGNTVELGDNILRLNSDFPVGSAPTENAGLEIQRGTSGVTNLILWDESTDEVFITQGGTLKRVSIDETVTFTNTTNTAAIVVSGGIVTWNHNKNRQFFKYVMADGSNKEVDVEATFVSANQTTFDVSGFGALVGTWSITG